VNSKFPSIPLAILIGAGLISLSILISGGVVKFKKPGTSAILSQNNPNQQAPNQPSSAPPEPQGPVKVSIDDDPVLGDKNALVTLIEFSDYECPFCKRHYSQTLPQIKKDYIDTGKVKMIFRDLPLSFHDPMATTEAIAANCARDQGGDASYFKYHDEIFKRTASNGNGLTKDVLYTIASDLGFNSVNFKACLDSEKYKDEVQKDLADAQNAGASGTPSFFIGKSASSGIIEGTKIVGAQPYSAFQTAIDGLLK